VFFEYEVQPGDTVSGVAERFGIGVDHILWNNVDVIEDADSLSIGAVLQVPGVEGIIHSARLGDTASDLAVEYDSTTEAIVEFEANGFGGNPDNLPIGALILVPGGRRIPPPAEAVSPAPNVEAATWAWPATGRLTNVFGGRHPLGIDISMVVGTPLRAAMSGQVVFVGGSACCSYGYHVIIDHGEGYETLYAHLSEVYVSTGQWVSGGEIIARSGNTGYSTGPHLHFEVRQNEVYRDPLTYLP
jgi:murein DD-endopeptidase MepM/ murein hydrolase activator NlpD